MLASKHEPINHRCMPASIIDDFELTGEPVDPGPEQPEPTLPLSINDAASQGGRARADALAPEKRREIARKAAASRWHNAIPYATHEGSLKIGELDLPVAVLEGGMRLIS